MPRKNNNKKQRQSSNKPAQRQESRTEQVSTSNPFTVYIDEGELAQIKRWVEIKDNIETGGDLFGLWMDSRTAVVQFVLGPGKNCSRTTVSFFQDVEYLREAGQYLTQKHGLCNIGQWHSHHRLRLARPSGGDEHTVWSNMPNLGLQRYIVFIATIDGHGKNLKVNIRPFLFEIQASGKKKPVENGTLNVLKGKGSPFRRNKVIVDHIKNGQEVYPGQNKDDESSNKISSSKKKGARLYTSEKEIWLSKIFTVHFTIVPLHFTYLVKANYYL